MSRTTDLTRGLPAAPEMEKGVISCIVQHADYALPKAQAILKASHFYIQAHAIMFQVLEEMYREGAPIDLTTVMQVLSDKSLMDKVGGPGNVAQVFTFAPSALQVEHYARAVQDKWTRRRILAECEKSAEEAFTGDEPAADVLARTEGRILSLRGEEARGTRTMGGREAYIGVIDTLEKKMSGEAPIGTPTGFPTLDAKTGGITQGLILIGAETSGGKSILAMSWLVQLLRAGKRVRYYSLEMPKSECMLRFVCHLSGVHLSRLLNPRAGLTEHEISSIIRVGQTYVHLLDLLTISDDSDLTASAIRAECRREHTIEPLGAVIVDYTQKLTPEDPRAIREQQVATSSTHLKKLANDLEIPVISPVQLNADNGARESKSLLFDADAFIRIEHRRDADGEPEEVDSEGNRLCSIWVEKWRQGDRWYRVPAIMNGGKMTLREATPEEAGTQPSPALRPYHRSAAA